MVRAQHRIVEPDRERRTRGQSFVEFALVLPVLLILVLAALDFGRVYLGWVNVQNMARIAANFAANHASAWEPPITADDVAAQQRYQDLLRNDSKAINCTLPSPLPDPAFPAGTALGSPVEVRLSCQFQVITPIVSHIVGGQVLVGASAVFPVKQGVLTGSGGGTPPLLPPVADFIASPSSGYAPLTVKFLNNSLNQPTSYTWQFGDGESSFQAEPEHSYDVPGTYTVTLTAANAGGFDTTTELVTVEPTPTSGPIPEFTASPRFGPPGLQVSFTNLSTGSAPITYLWTFGDGTTSTATNPTKTYLNPGVYTVSLRATDANGENTQVKTAFVIVECIVPNFAGIRRNDAQSLWSSAGFTTQVQFRSGRGNYIINYQSLPGGLRNPPGGCNAVIEVGP